MDTDIEQQQTIVTEEAPQTAPGPRLSLKERLAAKRVGRP